MSCSEIVGVPTSNTLDPNQQSRTASVQVSPPQAQISPTTSPGQNVPSITQNKKGQQHVFIDDRQPPAPQQVISRGGGGSQSVPFEDSLNSLIKNQILLELAYT